MEAIDFVARAVEGLLQRLPVGAHCEATVRTKSQIDQSDDYDIDWELIVKPTSPLSCPIELFASYGSPGECSWGFFFDTRGRIASHLDLKLGQRNRQVIAFGTEPIRMRTERVVAIIEAVVEGRVKLQYRVLARHLTQTEGIVLVGGEPQRFGGYGLPIGVRKVFQYAPWAPQRPGAQPTE